MLSTVLRSQQAVQINIAIMRAFVRLRELLANNRDLARTVKKHDQQIAELFQHVKALLEPPSPGKKRQIGFDKPKDRSAAK